jgi:hypothetical protein
LGFSLMYLAVIRRKRPANHDVFLGRRANGSGTYTKCL